MHDDQSHPLLAQVPLTVSPFVSLPTASTLPYTYKQLPPGLPPASTLSPEQQPSDDTRAKYVVSSSGHAAHPSDLIQSCRALQDHLDDLNKSSAQKVADWEGSIRARELAEKRRVAPGWLDSQQRILEPVKHHQPDLLDTDVAAPSTTAATSSRPNEDDEEGRELDRMFGTMKT